MPLVQACSPGRHAQLLLLSAAPTACAAAASDDDTPRPQQQLIFKLAQPHGAVISASVSSLISEHCQGFVPSAGSAALRRGALLPGPRRGTAYRLGARLHSGPRSLGVFAATELPAHASVALKVVEVATASGARAALQEARIGCRLTTAGRREAIIAPTAAWAVTLQQRTTQTQQQDDATPRQQPVAAVLMSMPLAGESAASVLHRRRGRGQYGLPPGALRSLARDTLAALDGLAAARPPVAHRDVKPHNVLLLRLRPPPQALPAGPQWALSDFGSAAELRPTLRWRWPPRIEWTVPDHEPPPYETPAYLPPEAVLHLPVMGAADVWSLGCTLFEAATGEVLFGGIAEAAAALALAGGLNSSDNDGSSSSSGNGSDETPWRTIKAAGIGAGRAGPGGPPREAAAAERRARAADAAHVALMRRLLGPLPPRLVAASPVGGRLCDPRGEPCAPVHGRATLAQRLARSRARLPPRDAAALAALLGRMLRYDPADRATPAQLLRDAYFCGGGAEEGGGGGSDGG